MSNENETGQNLVAIEKPTQTELFFNGTFTVEANMVKFSCLFPPHSPEIPLFSTKYIESIPGGGVLTTELITATSPFQKNGEIQEDRVPGDFEKKVFYAIVSLWVIAGRPDDGIIQFPIGKLLDHLGMSKGGKCYQMLKESIDRISRSTMTIKGSFVSAPDMRKETKTIPLFLDCKMSESRRGRKSLNGESDHDFCRVRINTTLISNIIHDYTVVLRVKDYTAARSKYYRRLIDIIEYDFQRGIAYGKDRVEYLLGQLIKNLPLDGDVKHISTIIKRLQPTFDELERIGGYKYEIQKVGNDAVFTVFSRHYTKGLADTVTFEEEIESFLEKSKAIHGQPLHSLLMDSDVSVYDFLKASRETVEYNGKTYYQTFHILDALTYQFGQKGYSQKAKKWSFDNSQKSTGVRIARSILAGKELKLPDGFRAYDERYKALMAEKVKHTLDSEEHNRSLSAAEAVFVQAQELVTQLTPSGRKKYVERLQLKYPDRQRDMLDRNFTIAQLLKEDIENGELSRTDFALIPTVATLPQAANQRLLHSISV